MWYESKMVIFMGTNAALLKIKGCKKLMETPIGQLLLFDKKINK